MQDPRAPGLHGGGTSLNVESSSFVPGNAAGGPSGMALSYVASP